MNKTAAENGLLETGTVVGLIIVGGLNLNDPATVIAKKSEIFLYCVN